MKLIVKDRDTINLGAITPSDSRIFAKTSSGIYKLQQFNSDGSPQTWGFAHIFSSTTGAVGFNHPTIHAAIQAVMEFGQVYVFDTNTEALEWICEFYKN